MLKRLLKRLLNPTFIIFAVLGVSVIAALLAFGNARQVLGLMAGFPRIYLLWFFLLMVGYEVVRGAQWHFLLGSLDIRPPLHIQVFAYLASEMAKLVPIGNYFENYILERAEGTDIGRSSAATTLVVLIEVGVSLLGVVVLGLGTWTGWIRPLIVLGVAAFALLVWLTHRRHHTHGLPRWLMRHSFTQLVLEELRRFRQGTADLLDPRVLAVATGLGALYLVIAGSALFLVIRGLAEQGLSLGHVSLGNALAVYFFSLAFSLIFPLPVDIGVLELSATGAWLALGLDRTSAVTIVLLNRVLSLASTVLIALMGIAVLHEGFLEALAGRRQLPGERPQPPGHPDTERGNPRPRRRRALQSGERQSRRGRAS
jgi:hypothetical protein